MIDNRRKYLLLIKTAIFILSAIPIYISAQNNVLKIDDECYAIYEKGGEVLGTDSVFIYSDMMRKLAISIGDTEAEVFSYVLEERHYRHIGDYESYTESAELTRMCACKNGAWRPFYRSYAYEVKYLIEQNRITRALSITREFYDMAKNDDNTYGLFFGNDCMALIYKKRGQAEMAKYYYREAINEANKMKTTHALTSIYYDLASLYELGSDSALYILKEGYDRCKSHTDSIQFQAHMAENYAFRGDKQQFATWRKLMSKQLMGDDSLALLACRSALEGNYAKAVETSMKIKSQSLRDEYLERFAMMAHDTATAYMAMKEKADAIDALNEEIVRNDLHDMDMQLKKDKMVSDAKAETLKMRNIELLLSLVIIVLLIGVIIVIYHYVKQRSRALENEKRVSESLERALSIQKNFLQNMSHEVRTPLNAICGFSQLLCDPDMRETLSEEEKSNFCDVIVSNTDLLTTLVNDILDISDMESGKYKMTLEEVSCNSIAQHALDTATGRCPSGVRMYMTTDVENVQSITTDQRRVSQVLINFLTNACKHTKQGEIILNVSTKAKDGYLTYSVTDTGEGVPDDKADIIFERFEKLDSFAQGTGLGLAICRTIAELMKGGVYLDTEYKGGARFCFDIPMDK